MLASNKDPTIHPQHLTNRAHLSDDSIIPSLLINHFVTILIHLNVNQVLDDVQINVYDCRMVQLYVKMLNDPRFVITAMTKTIYPAKLKDLNKIEEKKTIFMFFRTI